MASKKEKTAPARRATVLKGANFYAFFHAQMCFEMGLGRSISDPEPAELAGDCGRHVVGPAHVMKASRISVFMRLVCGALLMLGGAQSHAAEYPSKPIRMIVPSPAGGGMDSLARTVGQAITERWGQQVVVDLRAGAAGIVGTDIAAKAVPDGYTFMLAWIAPLAINPALYKELPYDVLRNFEPVMEVATTPHILVVSPSLGVTTTREFVEFAKRKPREVTYGSSGIGGSSHLAGELFSTMAGVTMLHVPYKGTPPALVDIMGGRLHAMFAAAAPALPHVRSGKIRAIAVTTRAPSPMVPGAPTIADVLPGFEAHTWYGMVAPARTNKALIASVNAEVARYLRQPKITQMLAGQGFDVVASSPQEFAAFLRTELAKWKKVVTDGGIRAE